jgi:hypothetical protein
MKTLADVPKKTNVQILSEWSQRQGNNMIVLTKAHENTGYEMAAGLLIEQMRKDGVEIEAGTTDVWALGDKLYGVNL